MGRKRSPGLTKRGEIWHIDKTIHGRRVRQSCKTDSLEDAEALLARITEQIRLQTWFGVRPERSFETAAARYVREHAHKKSIRNDIQRLKDLVIWIGEIPINKLHQGSIESWISTRREQGRAAGTINHGIKLINRILKLAASEWVDDTGLTWLEHPRTLRLLPDKRKREPYPLSWEEQTLLFSELPPHLREMALFMVNTGCRDQEVCQLRWDWEVKVPELGTSVFILPGSLTKNGDERLVVLNRVALSVIDACRGRHATNVFVYRGKPTTRMMNKAWLRAREVARLRQVRVHDLKHTFGRRLRAAGVSFEDRQDLLGHRSYRVTTHYSAPELSHLIEMANTVCESDRRKPELVVLKRALR